MIVYVWDKDGARNAEKLYESGHRFSNLILFGAHEFDYRVGHFELLTLINLAIKNNIKLDLIVGAPEEVPVELTPGLLNHCNIHYYETFWFSKVRLELLNHKKERNESSTLSDYIYSDISYKFICLNYKPHNHRCMIVDLLAKYDLLRDNAVSWNQKYDHASKDNEVVPLGYDFKYWTPRPLKLSENMEKHWFDQFEFPLEYSNSFCQLVTETSMTMPVVTEKTCMSLFHMKPFLVAGCKGYHKVLERLGFKLYTEIFDYQFDSINDHETRYEALVNNLVRINFLSYNELRNIQEKLYSKLLYNKQIALDLATNKDKQPSILNRVYEESKNQTTIHDLEFNQIYEDLK